MAELMDLATAVDTLAQKGLLCHGVADPLYILGGTSCSDHLGATVYHGSFGIQAHKGCFLVTVAGQMGAEDQQHAVATLEDAVLTICRILGMSVHEALPQRPL